MFGIPNKSTLKGNGKAKDNQKVTESCNRKRNDAQGERDTALSVKSAFSKKRNRNGEECQSGKQKNSPDHDGLSEQDMSSDTDTNLDLATSPASSAPRQADATKTSDPLDGALTAPNRDLEIMCDASHHVSQHTIESYDKVRAQQAMILKNIGKLNSEMERRAEINGCTNLRSDVDMQAMQTSHHLKELAQFFTRAPHDTLTSAAAKARFEHRPLSINRREYEERFMHEPSGAERPCANGVTNGTCFASYILNNGVRDPNFTLCEFYDATEYARIERNGWVWPTTTNVCILCLRAEIFSQFMNTRCSGSGVCSAVNYSPIANVVGEKGEYTPSSCFLSSSQRYEGVFDPVKS